MAKIEVLIPFILYYEAGGAKSCFKKIGGKVVYDPSLLSLEKQFMECREKGLANVPHDRGGLTMCGVTYTTYAAYCNRKKRRASESGLRKLNYSEWLDILKAMFWDKWDADKIENQAVANILVDWAWMSGITGIKRPQRILHVAADGIVGPKTLGAVNSSSPESLFDELHNDRIAHVESIIKRTPSQKVFLRGWMRRINAITYGGLKYE